MNKLFVFLLVAVSVLISFGLSSRVTANKNQSAVVNPTATPTRQFSAEIEKIELDRKSFDSLPAAAGKLSFKSSFRLH
jgi:hypothetical protein